MNKKLLNETNDSRTFKLLKRKYIDHLSCPLCGPNKGCNRYKFGIDNNWKNDRKTQYR